MPPLNCGGQRIMRGHNPMRLKIFLINMRKLRYKKGEWIATRDGENKTFASSLEALEWLLK